MPLAPDSEAREMSITTMPFGSVVRVKGIATSARADAKVSSRTNARRPGRVVFGESATGAIFLSNSLRPKIAGTPGDNGFEASGSFSFPRTNRNVRASAFAS